MICQGKEEISKNREAMKIPSLEEFSALDH